MLLLFCIAFFVLLLWLLKEKNIFLITSFFLLFFPAVIYVFMYVGFSFSWASILSSILFFGIYLKRLRYNLYLPDRIQFKSIIPILFLPILWFLFYHLALYWGAFYPIAERMRDYALLNAVYLRPLMPLEPWLPPHKLHYYIYSYRWLSCWGKIFGVPVSELYHLGIAFYLPFLGVSGYYLIKKMFKWHWLKTVLVSMFLAMASNLSGVLNVITQSNNWWSASRVIEGTISEFPVWSFILGDFHPHLFAQSLHFFIILFSIVVFKDMANRTKTFLTSYALIFLPLFFYSINSWDLPLVFTLSLIFVLAFFSQWKTWPWINRGFENFEKHAFLGFLIVSFLLMSFHIKSPGGLNLNFTGIAEFKSRLSEFLLHWGFPMFWSFIFLFKLKSKWMKIVLSLSLVVAIIFNIVWPLLALSLSGSVAYFVSENDLKNKSISSLLIFIFAVLLGVEFLYVDDMYTGIHERTNTVFKFYSFIWPIWHLLSFVFIYKIFGKYRMKYTYGLNLSIFLIVIIFSSYSVYGISLRAQNKTKHIGTNWLEMHGYKQINKLLKSWKNNKGQIVVEGLGKQFAYEQQGLIAVVTNQYSYLAWPNHIILLTDYDEEVRRRIDVINTLYGQTLSCESKLKLMQKEKIDYLVWGNWERQNYQNNIDFSCMKKFFKGGGLTVYSN